jgi:hypothetical protein
VKCHIFHRWFFLWFWSLISGEESKIRNIIKYSMKVNIWTQNMLTQWGIEGHVYWVIRVKITQCLIGKTYITYQEMRISYSILVWQPERTRSYGKPSCKWVDDMKFDLTDFACGLNWTGSG